MASQAALRAFGMLLNTAVAVKFVAAMLSGLMHASLPVGTDIFSVIMGRLKGQVLPFPGQGDDAYFLRDTPGAPVIGLV